MVIFLEPSIGQWSNNLCCHWYKKKEYTGETSCLVKQQIHTYRRHIRQQQYQQYAIKEKFHKFKSLLKKRLQNLLKPPRKQLKFNIETRPTDKILHEKTIYGNILQKICTKT